MRITGLTALIALSLTSACSSNAVPVEKTETSTPKVFSDEDKRAASLLSVGGDDIDSSASPQYRATLCRLALETIEDRMRMALSGEQREAFAQAQSVYRQRASTGFSSEEQRLTREEVEAAYPDENDRARFAIGCLQALV